MHATVNAEQWTRSVPLLSANLAVTRCFSPSMRSWVSANDAMTSFSGEPAGTARGGLLAASYRISLSVLATRPSGSATMPRSKKGGGGVGTGIASVSTLVTATATCVPCRRRHPSRGAG